MTALFSLLWTDSASRSLKTKVDEHLIADLNLTPLVRQLSPAPEYERQINAILLSLCQDEAVIRYRQAILDDLLRSPRLVARFESALEAIVTLESYLMQQQWRETALQQVAWRLSELENYVNCIVLLDTLLTEAGESLQSEGLIRLRDTLRHIRQEQNFQQLQKELPELLPKIRGIRSITVGINVDEEMRPTTATLLSANTFKFTEASFIGKLFGKNGDDGESPNPLHNSRHVNTGGTFFEVELRRTDSPFMPPLFRDLTTMLDDICRPIVRTLRKYAASHSQFLIGLKSEIAFYLGAVRLINTLRETGLPLCLPEIVPASERITRLKNLYNLNLALLLKSQQKRVEDELVLNDIEFNADGRIFILTGPNQGGKTTYTQAVGLAQILFQAGLYVPAESACMSVVDGIYTHFATEEKLDSGTGRLGEEAQRLSNIFQQATRQSLILLNESLASTTMLEGLYLARDVVRVLRVLGARAIFATHLHDLALECEELNANTPGDSLIVSLVSLAQIEENDRGSEVRRTYRILPGVPSGKSYGVELAARYGISYGQLMDMLKKRDVL